MARNWVRYNDIEEKRDGYYVVYTPVFTGQEFAILNIYVYEPQLISDIKNIAESELRDWISRYSTPLMVMISNKTELNSEKNIVDRSYLLGHPVPNGIYSCWGDYPVGEEPKIDLSQRSLAKIYEGLSFKTYAQVVAQQKEEANGRRLLLIAMTLWLCVVPALIAFFGWKNPFVSLLALFYSLYIATQKGLKLWGIKNKPEEEIEKESEELLREHHHYHCKLNPEGFLRLKCENFNKERLDMEKNKIESMRN